MCIYTCLLACAVTYFLARLHCATECRVVTGVLYSGYPGFKSQSRVVTLTQNLPFFLNPCGPGSVVCKATGYGLDGPGIESRWGATFSAPVQTDPGAHSASCTLGTESFPGVKSGRCVTMTPHPFLVPWPRKSRAILLVPYRLYGLYRVSVPVQWCTLPTLLFLNHPSKFRHRITL